MDKDIIDKLNQIIRGAKELQFFEKLPTIAINDKEKKLNTIRLLCGSLDSLWRNPV